jgi:hypothetical protein
MLARWVQRSPFNKSITSVETSFLLAGTRTVIRPSSFHDDHSLPLGLPRPRILLIHASSQRGIDVVLEIDTPGHTAIVAESHPDLIACYERTPFNTYAHQPPAGQLRFADSRVADFVSGVFTASAGLSGSRYFSTGGDELNVACMVGAMVLSTPFDASCECIPGKSRCGRC